MGQISNLFEMRSTSNKVMLHQQYYKYKFESGMNVSVYLSGLNVLLKKLETVNEKVDKSSVIAKIINDLLSEYDNFRHSWNLTTATAPNLTKLLEEQLLVVENSLKQSSSVEAEAFLSTKKQETKKNPKKKQFFCYGCKKKGHFKKNCPISKVRNKSKDYKKLHEAEGLYAGNVQVNSEEAWYVDSAASFHMTRNYNWFDTYEELKEKINITIANNKIITAVGKGTIDVEVFNGKHWTVSKLNEVMYVPDMGPSNLFSVSKACDRGLKMFGDSKTFGLKRKSDNKTIVIGKRTGNVWKILLRRR